jgi:hypothetical protein
MLTLLQLKTGPVGRASGLDVQSQDFLSYCNDSVRQLMNRGNWWSTVQVMTGCVRDNCVVWPREVAAVLALNTCRDRTIVHNKWFQFRPLDSSWRSEVNSYNRNGWAGSLITESLDTTPVFNPIKAQGFAIRFFIDLAADAGKTITVYGTDVNGQEIISTRADGTIQSGVQVTLAVPSADTPMAIRHVTRIVKDETSGPVRAYQHNVAQGFLLDLGIYQPTEKNPEYVTSRIIGCRSGGGGGCYEQISAMVKLKFISFKYDGDLVQIDSQDAIRDMLLSLRNKEQGDMPASAAYEMSAFRELNYQMKNLFPDEQFIVNFLPFGRNDALNNYQTRIGMI